MDNTETDNQSNSRLEYLAVRRAREKANAAKWGVNTAVFSYATLVAIIILVSRGIDFNIVASLATIGLVTIWVMGRRQGNHLFQTFFASEMSSLQQEPAEKSPTLTARLTPREIETLNYVAQGYSNKQIANELGISQQTIKNFISGILTKLNASSRTEATVIAIKHGLISVR